MQWHLSFVWIYVGTGLFYLGYQVFSGNYRQVLFTPSDIRGVWPMVHYYFFFGPKPAAREVYNPLQKLAYTSVLGLGLLSVLTGIAVWKPIQFSWLAWMMGGFHWARIWHFAVMWAILFFLLGHLIMVALHGWSNFTSMLTGWKKNPEYLVGTNLPGQDILDEDLRTKICRSRILQAKMILSSIFLQKTCRQKTLPTKVCLPGIRRAEMDRARLRNS